MSWWRRQPEVRGYTETQLLDQFTRAIAGNVRHGALGGLQCAAGAVARAFAAAEVDGDAEGLLDPATLYQMGYDLVREGQTVWLLEAGTGRLRLLRASTGTDVYHGGPAADGWTYQLTMSGPSITTTVRASADQVIHIRQNSDPTSPWRGRSGLAVAESSGGLAATLVRGLTAEGEIPSLTNHSSTVWTISDRSRQHQGQPSIVAFGWPYQRRRRAAGGQGDSSAPLTDWKSYTIQPEYMAAGVLLHALALQETAGVCGLPAPMVPGSAAAGPAHREAFRQFVALTVQPLGRILEAEVSRVLERPVRLLHHQLASADVASKARAFKALVENEIDRERALTLVGWS